MKTSKRVCVWACARVSKNSRVCMLTRNCIETMYLVYWLLKCSWSLHFRQFFKVQFHFYFSFKPHTYCADGAAVYFSRSTTTTTTKERNERQKFCCLRNEKKIPQHFVCIQKKKRTLALEPLSPKKKKHASTEYVHIYTVHIIYILMQTIFLTHKCLTFILVGWLNTIQFLLFLSPS